MSLLWDLQFLVIYTFSFYSCPLERMLVLLEAADRLGKRAVNLSAAGSLRLTIDFPITTDVLNFHLVSTTIRRSSSSRINVSFVTIVRNFGGGPLGSISYRISRSDVSSEYTGGGFFPSDRRRGSLLYPRGIVISP